MADSPDEDRAKREEDRINRAMNSVGRRGARPMSWNVPTSSSSSTKDSIKSLQDQLKSDEKKPVTHFPPVVVNAGYSSTGAHAQQNPSRNLSPSPVPPGPDDLNGSVSPHLIGSPGTPGSQSPSIPAAAAAGGGIDTRSLLQKGEKDFLDAEKDKKSKQEEDRLDRWMRKGGVRIEREQGATSPDARAYSSPSPNPLASGPKFQNEIVLASRSLRKKQSEELAKWALAASNTSRSIGETITDEPDILILSRALETAIIALRTTLDSGADGFNHYAEISSILGQLYIVTIGAV